MILKKLTKQRYIIATFIAGWANKIANSTACKFIWGDVSTPQWLIDTEINLKDNHL